MAEGKYLALQNKALHQGMRLAYVSIPVVSDEPFTTNGHIMVRGELSEVKPLKDQQDIRSDGVNILKDKVWASLKVSNDTEVEPHEDKVRGYKVVKAGDQYYQALYVEYIMARYSVAEWVRSSKNLIALDASNNILGVIAPVEEES